MTMDARRAFWTSCMTQQVLRVFRAETGLTVYRALHICGPNIFLVFGWFFWPQLELHQFVLAKIVCGLCHIPYATFGAHETLQKIHWKKFEMAQGFAYERKS